MAVSSPVERRFATTMKEADRLEPGLIIEDDGYVWEVLPDGSRLLLTAPNIVRTGLAAMGLEDGATEGQVPAIGADGEVEFVAPALLMASVEITDAQTKALPTTPIEIVSAPGDDKFLLLFNGTVSKRPRGDWVPYGNVTEVNNGNAFAGIFYEAVAGVAASALIIDDTDLDTIYRNMFAGNGQDEMMALVPHAYAHGVPGPTAGGLAAVDRHGTDDRPLVFGVLNPAGDFTGGNPANSLFVTVFYAVIDL